MRHLGNIDVQGLQGWRQAGFLCEVKSPYFNHFSSFPLSAIVHSKHSSPKVLGTLP